MKPRKRIQISDAYFGLLLLPVIALIAIISEIAVPWVTAITNFFHHK